MTKEELREEINIELEMMEEILRELSALQKDLGDREPSLREKTAAAAFMAQFYGGVENILKRISRFHSVPLPKGDSWHMDLLKRFCEPAHQPLPALFDQSLALSMGSFRKFRHVIYHSYGPQLNWSRLREGVAKVGDVFIKFKLKLAEYLQTLN